jgi:apolipoprotein N-acyltransferase
LGVSHQIEVKNKLPEATQIKSHDLLKSSPRVDAVLRIRSRPLVPARLRTVHEQVPDYSNPYVVEMERQILFGATATATATVAAVRTLTMAATRTTDLICLMVSSGLFVLSQPPFDLGFLATIALVPWLFRTRRASPAGALAWGLLFGVMVSIGGANWIFDALAAEGSNGLRRIMAAVLIAIWAKGLLFAGAGWVVVRLRSRSPAIAILIPSLVFGLGEFWIAESAWGLPLLLLGHSQISVPGVAQLAVAIGVPGISAMLFALNLALVSAIIVGQGGRRLAFVLGSTWLIAMVAGLPLARVLSPEPRAETRQLLIIQPDICRHDRWELAHQEALLERIAAQTTRAIAESPQPPDAILWPESLLTLPIEPDDRRGRRLQQHVDEWGVPVVLGLVRRAPGAGPDRYLNSVVWWSPILGPVDVQDKVRAIPVVESSRRFWGQEILDWAIANAADGPRVVEAMRAEPLTGAFTVSPALCYEILFPSLVADRRDDESVAIVNLADDSWVEGEVLDQQLIAAAAFRAIEQRLTMIRVSHGGASIAIDRFGREIASLPPNRVGQLTIEVAATPRPSTVEKGASLLPMVVVVAAMLIHCATMSSTRYFGPRIIDDHQRPNRGSGRNFHRSPTRSPPAHLADSLSEPPLQSRLHAGPTWGFLGGSVGGRTVAIPETPAGP